VGPSPVCLHHKLEKKIESPDSTPCFYFVRFNFMMFLKWQSSISMFSQKNSIFKRKKS
jgi:hypothetical protein